MKSVGGSIYSYLEKTAASRPDKRLLGAETGWLTARKARTLTAGVGEALRRMGLGDGACAALRTGRGGEAAVVVGLPDEKQGEVPAAMVVAEAGVEAVSPALPKNELPVLYRFVDFLPMTASGKPDRKKIREVLTRCRNG